MNWKYGSGEKIRKKKKCRVKTSRVVILHETGALTCFVSLVSIIEINLNIYWVTGQKWNKNTDQGRYLENNEKQSCHSCMWHSALTCCIILPSIIQIFQMVTWYRPKMKYKYGSGDIIRKWRQNCHSCLYHATLTCPLILPSSIKIFLMVAVILQK